MYTSVTWLNDYLDPAADADEQADWLTRAGFPLEGREDVAVNGCQDVRQDYEMTSNRGDCVCHYGLAREIAAISGRSLKTLDATPKAAGPAASSIITVRNDEPGLCPLYTARVIRGVTVGPSPEWLANRLRARGDIPRNNLVDLSNFVLFELGQPTHLFDLAKLKDATIIIRRARDGEPLLPIGEGAQPVKLTADDLVIADAKDAVAIAGVKGGAPTAVSNSTTDIVIEAATFDPVAVRTTSRRHGIASDSAYRFERGVHAGQIEHATNRLCGLILEIAGGELCKGIVSDGAPIPPPRTVSMRCRRCRAILGVEISDQQVHESLARLGLEPKAQKTGDGVVLTCTIPPHRLDLVREVDLIEEVGRMFGHDNIPIRETIQVRVAPPQSTELARRAVNDALVGMGFVESVTHSLISEQEAAPFLREGERPMRVDDERASATPILRPSILPSLLRVLAHNHHNGVESLRLFETASTWVYHGAEHEERVRLALLMDADAGDESFRLIRGVCDRLIELLLGDEVVIEAQPSDELPWLSPAASISANGTPLGHLGFVRNDVHSAFDLDAPVLATELDLPSLFERFPPEKEARALPSQPAIARDLSVVVEESVRWLDLREAISAVRPGHLEAIEFVAKFRGKQIGAGRKSVTARLTFRAPDRTLTHDEVDEPVERIVAALAERFNAELRA